VNPAHTINATATSILQSKRDRVIVPQLALDPVEPGASAVIANGFQAIEVSDGSTGFAASQIYWPVKQDAAADVCIKFKFILKATGTGANVRLAAKFKAQATGGDSSAAFSPDGFTVVPITFTTLGEVFEGVVLLDGAGFKKDDAVSVQVGRDGNNEMGAGTNDDTDVAVQIIAVEMGIVYT
jgi:hypothetical protein